MVRPRLYELDGLRALAVALVVVHHSLTAAIFQFLVDHGWRRGAELLRFVTGSGVELFFVLSGTVLLRPYLRRERLFNVRRYLWRRFVRLWPPYAVALGFAGAVIYLTDARPTWYSTQVLPKFSGIAWLRQAGIVNLGWPSYSGAWWSLNLEVIFYLLAPVLIAGLLRVRSRWLPFALLVSLAVGGSLASAAFGDYTSIFLTATVLPAASNVPGPFEVFQAFLIYLPSFALGIVIARFQVPVRYGRLLLAYGTLHVLLGLMYANLNVHLGFALLYAGMVIVALQGSCRMRRLLSEPHVVWLGERSYSLFLIHFPVFYLTSYVASRVASSRGAVYFVVSRGLGLPLALLAAMVIFWLVERRFARGLFTADSFWPWKVPARP